MTSRSRSASGRIVAPLMIAVAVAVACSAAGGVDPFAGSSNETAPPQSAGGAGGSGGDAPDGLDPGADGCDPPCGAAMMCSATGVCIEEGTCAVDRDCAAGLVCGARTSTCVPGGGCGAQEIGGQPRPNLAIVLDRSCSMTHKDKWSHAVDALLTLVATFGPKIRFGLTLFPDPYGDGCSQGQIPVLIDDDTGPAIVGLLQSALDPLDPYYPSGPCNTNIDSAMHQTLTGDPGLGAPEHPSYVLLITDGKQEGCELQGGDAGTLQIITDLLQTKNVKTFVVGFGSGIYEPTMNAFAEAGGMPKSDPADPSLKFYEADDQPQLEAALAVIAGKALGCTFDLDTQPPDPSQLHVFFDDDPAGIPNDPANGWVYDPATNQVTFHGAACAELESGAVSDVDIVYGCDEPAK